MTKRIVVRSIVAAVVGIALGQLVGHAAFARTEKITICHATGSTTNPFVKITIARSAVVTAHIQHQHREDIIPAFRYYHDQGEGGPSDGQYVDVLAQGDQATLANGCEVPTPVVTPTPPVPTPPVTPPTATTSVPQPPVVVDIIELPRTS